MLSVSLSSLEYFSTLKPITLLFWLNLSFSYRLIFFLAYMYAKKWDKVGRNIVYIALEISGALC